MREDAGKVNGHVGGRGAERLGGSAETAANAGPANLATALLPGKENAGWRDSRFSRRWPPGGADATLCGPAPAHPTRPDRWQP